MPNQDYKWKRFWCPRSGSINLSDGGYLVNPDSEWGHHYNSELVDFETILKYPCLILLGEPGIGKTHTIETEISSISNTDKKDYEILRLNLASHGDENRLIKKLFEGQIFTDWVNGTHDLHIFLDSFDECWLRIDNLATLLVEEFKEHCDNVHRLYLRIACRTVVFSNVSNILEKGFEQIFGKESLGIYELAPLRRLDVIDAANYHSLDSSIFIEEVSRKGVVPFAIKPITLDFLLNTYQKHNCQFPPNQKLSDLYSGGCIKLCEEPQPHRSASPKLVHLEVKERLIIAARIAAVLIFSKSYAILTGLNQGNANDEDVLLRELCWGSENANGRELQVRESAVRETLDTSLFSGHGCNRMGFAHQTYAEFLAAWYLKERNLNLSQIMSLIVHPDDSERRIVPQLYETVAWLAGMLPEVFREVMKTDPNVLLQSDIATVSEADKASLVESLLKLHNEEKLTYFYKTQLYKNLNHPKLPEQLQLYICDSTKSINARNAAIDIAEVCDVKAVQEYLADVALDPNQPSSLRINAAVAVCQIGDNKTRARLKPLAIIKPQNDVEEELKGCGLRAVWTNHIGSIPPWQIYLFCLTMESGSYSLIKYVCSQVGCYDYITVEDVFNALTQPISNTVGRRYQEFIARELAEYLDISDLPFALRWLKKQVRRRGLHYPFAQLSDAIMLKAWEHFEQPEVIQEFARVASLRLKNHEKIIDDNNPYKTVSFSQLIKDDDQKRRQLIEEIISIIPESEREPLWLLSDSLYSTAIIIEEDFLWMIERCNQSDSEHIQKIYARLINWKIRGKDLENADALLRKQVDALLTSTQNNPILRAEFSAKIEAIELGTPKAEEIRAEYLKYQEMPKFEKTKTLLEPSPKERVLAGLQSFESGQIDAWHCLCYEMTLKADSEYHGNLFESSLTNFPGWVEAEDSTKKRILQAASLYLIHGEPKNQDWLGTNSFPDYVALGYQTLRLLLQESPDFIASLSSKEWQKWTGIILAYPNWDRTEDKEHRQELANRAYENAPTEFIKVLMMLIDKDNQDYGSIHITGLITNCWDEPLAKAIFNKAKDTTLTSESFGRLLEILLKHGGVIEARAFAESLIPSPPPKNGEERKKAIAAARVLILHTENAGWSVVWPAIQQDPKFGREVLESVSYLVKYNGSVELRIKEEYIADLYIFIVKQYPDDDDKKQKSSKDEMLTGIESHTETPEKSIKRWRDYMPQRLQKRGTRQACEALRKIIHELPELKDKLQWILAEAESLTRRQTWQGFKPEQILQIVSKKELHTAKTILILASTPIDTKKAQIYPEMREIQNALRQSQKQHQFKVENIPAVQASDLRQALLDFHPQIVHFCGHGSGDEGVVLEDENGYSKLISTEALASSFKEFAEHIECVILNACNSQVQAEEIVKYIDYVIGMRGAIGENAAIEFAKGFYQALGAGKSIKSAYEFGCNAIQSENIPEHLTPTLLTRQSSNFTR